MRRNGAPAFDLLFDDGDIAVVSKPAGMPVHRSPGHEGAALCDLLVRRFPSMAGVGSAERPGVVHRLDIDTSGVTVFAKTQRAYLALRRSFEERGKSEKTYLAVVHGAIKPAEGTLRAPIGRKPFDSRRMAVVEDGTGRDAVTHWKTLARKGGLSLVEFRIETGRTHQIRVHAAYLGHPVAGDPLYGEPAKDCAIAVRPARTLLHAVSISFPHPRTGERVEFFALPPPDIVYAHSR